MKKQEESRAKEKQRNDSHTKKLEVFNIELQKEIKAHQQDVEKALKIHRANEKLVKKNDVFKQELFKLKEE